MRFCDYGCGQEAKYQFKNGKWCCSSNQMQCPMVRKKNSIQIKKIHQDPNGIYNSILYRKKLSEKKTKENHPMYGRTENQSPIYGIKRSKKTKTLQSKKAIEKYKNNYERDKLKLTIEKINRKYSFFSKIEEMRYNPDKPDEKEIQVHCKNHECENSKEKDGWFIPTKGQLSERIRALEKPYGMIENNFYCSQECKDSCLLYGLQSDPYKDNNLPYTPGELQTFRTFVLERDTYICQFCGDPATCVHHEKPQKLEPFFSLDPDYAWSCCEKCHYKKGHQDECSTGNLAKIVCRNRGDRFI